MSRDSIRAILLCIALCGTGLGFVPLWRSYRDSAYAHPPSQFREASSKVKPGMTLADAKAMMMPVSTECKETSETVTFALRRDRDKPFVVVSFFLTLKLDQDGRIVSATFNDG